jgi:hypothetical protein
VTHDPILRGKLSTKAINKETEGKMIERQPIESEYKVSLQTEIRNEFAMEDANFGEMHKTIRYLMFITALVLITLILVAGGYGEVLPDLFEILKQALG